MSVFQNRFRPLRFIIVAVFLIIAYYAYTPALVPALSTAGFLGLINRGIIIFLFVLALRQFFYLFFSVCEEIRREKLPSEYPLHPVSIIVPAYNEGVVIRDSIRKLLAMNYPAFEIIVVDDGSSDDTYDRALEEAATDPRVRVFRKTNSGKAKSLNFGIGLAHYPFVFCMDADSLVEPNAIRFGMRHFLDPDVVAVAGSVLVLNQKNAVTSFQTMEYLTGLNFYKSAQSYLGLVTIIPGPSGLFKRDHILEIGGYESDTFAEDCDLTLRLVTEGGRVVYEPYMEVRTEVPEEVLPLIKQRYRWNRGILQAVRKHLRKGVRSLGSPHGFLVISYMAVESLVLPVANVLIALLSLAYQFFAVDFSLLSMWLIVLVLLDLSVLLITLVDHRWPLKLLIYSVFNRFTYSFFQDLIKILSSIEEFAGIRMNWGKLDRIGVK
jgi:cellulose synthase/poly-beta-1,6-N-acetylglucosamine synthase-like glycosyltransferase